MYLRNNSSGSWAQASGDIVIDTLKMHLRIDEALDNGEFDFISDTLAERINPFTQCRLDFVDNGTTTSQYWYASSKCVLNVQTGRATHKVRLIEQTKILEKIDCEGLSFVRSLADTTQDTIKTVVERLNNIHKVYANGNDIFLLPVTLATYLDKIDAPEFEFESGLNMLEVLKEVGQFVGGMPRLTGENYNTLTFDFYNRQKDEIIIDAYEMIEDDQSEEDYCQTAGDNFDNVYSDKPGTNIVTHPYKGGYITPRSTTNVISNDNAQLIMPSDIYIPQKLACRYFTANVKMNLDLKGYNAQNEWVVISDYNIGTGLEGLDLDYTKELDITNNLIPKADYDELREKDGAVNKTNRLYFDKNVIGGLDYYPQRFYSGLTNERTILNILRDLNFNLTPEETIEIIKDSGLNIEPIVDLREITINSQNIFIPNQDIYKIMFNVEYQALSSGRFTSVKDSFNEFSNTGIKPNVVVGQGTRSKNLINAGRYNWATAQKLGNRYKHYIVGYDDIAEIPPLNSTYQGYVLTSVQIQWLGDFQIKALLTLDKNFNRLSEFLDLNQRYRTWEIEKGTFIRRRTIDDEYIVISSTPKFYPSENTRTSDLFKDAVSGILGLADASLPLTVGAAQLKAYTSGVASNNFNISCDSTAFGKKIGFTVKSFDNVSMGVLSDALDGTAFRSARQALYTDGLGRNTGMGVDFFKVGELFSNRTQAQRLTMANSLPIEEYSPIVPNNRMFRYGGSAGYDKSAGEAIEITKQFHFIADNSNIIVGFGLAELNPTISTYSNLPQLRLYYVPNRVSSMAINVNEYDGIILQTITARGFITKTVANGVAKAVISLPNVSSQSFAQQTAYNAWVLTDANGLIVLGANKPTPTTAINELVFNFNNRI